MRREDREVTETSGIYSIMKECSVCSLAFNSGDYPYVVPVNFGVIEENGVFTLYFHGAGAGTKMELMRQDNRVSFCMTAEETFEMGGTACGSTMRYRSVCGRGRTELIEDAGEKVKALSCIMRQYEKDGAEFTFDERIVERTAVFKLTAEQITGKVNRHQRIDR